MMLVSRLLATVGSETVKILLAVPAMKLPSAALIRSNQLMRESMLWRDGTQKMRVACSCSCTTTEQFHSYDDYRFDTYRVVPALNRSAFTATITVFLYYQCLSTRSMQNFNVPSTSRPGATAQG
jgi:hypothetical protein